MTIESDIFEIEKVYGSPESSTATGEIMRINSLFPSKVDDAGQTKVRNFGLKLSLTGLGWSCAVETEAKISFFRN